jgi:hypothetical protein
MKEKKDNYFYKIFKEWILGRFIGGFFKEVK